MKFEKISDKHYKAFKHDLFLSSIEIHEDKYVINNRYSKTEVPKRLKNYLKFMILESYKKDLKTFDLYKYSDTRTEGDLSIKKMMSKLTE